MANSETNPNIIHLHAIAHGRVQGVNYRAFVLEKARQLELKGFVRNLPSYEQVEIEAEGKKENLEELLVFLNQGPSFAQVDKVSVVWTKPSHKFQGFMIKY
jgi:acylphosphatase